MGCYCKKKRLKCLKIEQIMVITIFFYKTTKDVEIVVG